MAGADIANIMCNEAAIQAPRRKADHVAMVDFEKASDRVIRGLESNKLISEKEKEIVAHHEAGHAVAGWFLEHADPLIEGDNNSPELRSPRFRPVPPQRSFPPHPEGAGGQGGGADHLRAGHHGGERRPQESHWDGVPDDSS